jgi:arylsulfatase A-like enzyme
MPDSKPNILAIWGDDIGITNLSCYSDGLMGYRTPNIDRIADEGMRFTDSYGEQSCTAGRAAFITGQSVFRTGLSKVGMPAAPIGCRQRIPQLPSCSSRWATRPVSLARTILEIEMNFYRRRMALMSSSATSIT